MSVFDLTALLVGLAAVFGYINHRMIRLPDTVGILFIAVTVSLGVMLLNSAVPGLGLRAAARDLLERVNLPDTFLAGALSFLLFAGAFQVDMDALWIRKGRVLALATIGVIIATALFGVGIYWIFRWFGVAVPLTWCLVLGAIVAPTDPIAVLGVLKRVGLEPPLQATIAGESLFNDGVGVVVFTMLLAMATGAPGVISATAVLERFLLEAVGGIALGLATGYLAFRAMRSIDKYDVEFMISLALVMVTYSIADLAHVSGPIAVVVAGLLIGHHGARFAMSETTRSHIEMSWSSIDEVLNALLFLLIGFELIAIDFSGPVLAAAAGAVVLSLVSRVVSITVPALFFDLRMQGKILYTVALTWGGLRGGVSIALALSLPEGPYRGPLLSACYAVVVFTIVVQGLTLERLLRLVSRRDRNGACARQSLVGDHREP